MIILDEFNKIYMYLSVHVNISEKKIIIDPDVA